MDLVPLPSARAQPLPDLQPTQEAEHPPTSAAVARPLRARPQTLCSHSAASRHAGQDSAQEQEAGRAGGQTPKGSHPLVPFSPQN